MEASGLPCRSPKVMEAEPAIDALDAETPIMEDVARCSDLF